MKILHKEQEIYWILNVLFAVFSLKFIVRKFIAKARRKINVNNYARGSEKE